jgi:hypothetical protein
VSAAIAERVAAGAALLDEKRPGWWRQVDLAVLDLEDCRLCVIGQLFGPEWEYSRGSYGAGLAALGLDAGRYEEFAYGFDIENFREFADLTAEWRRLVAARRLAAERVKGVMSVYVTGGRIHVTGARVHPSANAYNKGCRCDECRELHKLACRRRFDEMEARGRADPSLIPHGTKSGYSNWGCRCDECTAGHALDMKRYHALRRASA